MLATTPAEPEATAGNEPEALATGAAGEAPVVVPVAVAAITMGLPMLAAGVVTVLAGAVVLRHTISSARAPVLTSRPSDKARLLVHLRFMSSRPP
jgi:hypothetical protein